MNNRQRAKYDAYQRITDFNTDNAALIAGIPGYDEEKAAFDADVTAIAKAGGIQQTSGSSSIVPATDSKEAMAQAVYKIILRAKVKARQLGNTELANQLDVPVSYITGATKTEAVLRATNLRKLLFDNLASLTTVAQTDIDTIDTAIAGYDGIKNHPIENRQTIKASGTDVLPGTFADADTHVDNMYSLLQSYVDASTPEPVNKFRLSMEVIDTGLRHTVVDITTVADAKGNALVNTTVTDTSNNKTYTSDEDGLVHIPTHKSGHFNFTISADGYQTVSFGADIKRGVQNDFTVRLIAV